MIINWKDHLVSLIVVILGITIAFYLESWREKRKTAQQEITYLMELERSLMQDRLFVDTLISINKFQQTALNRLLQSDDLPNDSIGNYLYKLFYNLPFSPQSGVYESMKATGSMQSLQDFDLASKITQLYEQDYRGAQEWDNAISEHIRDFYRPFVISRFQFTLRSEVDRRLAQSREFKGILFPYSALHEQKAAYYLHLDQRIAQTLDQIRDYLD